MRYQLLRTTPYLSGQVRWDIPLNYHYSPDDNNVGVHTIDTPNLYISPLSDNIIFNEGDGRDFLKYKHLDNIKHLFKSIGDDFYSAAGEYTGKYWLYNQGYPLDPYSHIYDMGARRMRFSRYDKQFSYLCPLWISEETDPKKLQFELSVGVTGEERDHIARCMFSLSDKICDYMYDYLYKSPYYVKPDPAVYPDIDNAPYMGVNDDVLNIKFDPDEASVAGVHVESGEYMVKDISYIIPSMLKREIPLMEFDNLLLYNFMENHMIAQQLINLNFVFNIEDISFFLKEKLQGKKVTISLRVLYDGQYLQIRDLYTNYDSIPCYRADLNRMSLVDNVLDYMGDPKIIDYLHINKFTQPIFHWTMVDNPGYIYNFYDGFAPVFMNNGDIYRIQGRYYDQADVSCDVSTVYNNANHWCRYYDYSTTLSSSVLNYIGQHKTKKDKYYSRLIINEKSMLVYIHNNRYDLSLLDWNIYNRDSSSDYGVSDHNIYLANHVVSQSVLSDLANDFSQYADIYTWIDGNSLDVPDSQNPINTYYYGTLITELGDDIFFDFFCTDSQYCTLFYISQYLITQSQNISYNRIFDFFKNILQAWVRPYRIEFNKSTYTANVAPIGEYHPTETNMFKLDNHNSYVLRYTGKLCPLFIDPDDEYYKNMNFRYRQWSDIGDITYYNKMIKTGYLPSYPSIDYYTFEKEQDVMQYPNWYNDYEGDIIWKNDGLLHIFPEKYTSEYLETSPQPYNEYYEEQKFWDLLYKHIGDIFQISELSVWFKHWLKDIYKISYNFDYPDERNVHDILYTVTFILR